MKALILTVFTSISLLFLFSFDKRDIENIPKPAFACPNWSYDSGIVTTVNYTNPSGVAIFFNDEDENETIEVYGPNGYSAWASVPDGNFQHFAVPYSGTYYVYVNYNNSCLVGTGVVTVP